MSFTDDTLTDTSNLALASHVGEIGATWAPHPFNAAGDMRISDANRCRSASSGYNLFYSSGVPQIADYTVSGTVRCVSNVGSGYAGVAGRVNPATNDWLWLIYNFAAGQWQLWETFAANSAMLGAFAQTLVPGTDYVVQLVMVGSSVTANIDGVQRIVPGVGSGVSAAGRAGLVGSGVFTDSTGLHIDRVSGADYRQLRFVGDSVTNGSNASDAAHSWPSLLATALGYPKIGNPVSATQIVDQCTISVSSTRNQVYLTDVSALDVWAWLTGYNDIRYFGTNANGLEAYTRILRAAVAWMSRGISDCYQASNAAWTLTGIWTTFQAGGVATKYSGVPGDKASISITGTAITFAYLSRWGLNDGATFTVKIDGTIVDTIDGNFGATSGYGGGSSSQYVMMAKRYGGLTAGAHTIEVQSTSSGVMQVGFATGNGEATAPEVRLCGPLKMTSTGYSSFAPYDKASDAAVAAYANAIIGVCRDAYVDGRNVKYANVNSYYSIADVDTDEVHPGDTGHAHINDAFMAAAPIPPSNLLLKLPPMSFRPAMNGNFQG